MREVLTHLSYWSSRSLESMTQILEALTHAAKRYEAHDNDDTRTEGQPELT